MSKETAAEFEISRLREKLQAVQLENKRLSEGLRCFSCRVAYSSENATEACYQAHREGWTHEWVSQRVIDLTQKCVEHVNRLQEQENQIEGFISQLEQKERMVDQHLKQEIALSEQLKLLKDKYENH